jgi:phospholipid transport system substrate-binding protein
MRATCRSLAVAVSALLLSAASAPAAPGPTQQLKATIERLLSVLQDPELKGEAKVAERRQAIRRIAEEVFDFEETARRALGQHWRTLTPAQRKEFVSLFSDLLEQAYLSKIEQYGGERIQYTGERVDGDLAAVSTRFTTKQGTEVPIDYRMYAQRDQRWLVYDVVIEGVSLVSNYRTQFNSIIRTSSYDELVRKMRSRASELQTPK